MTRREERLQARAREYVKRPEGRSSSRRTTARASDINALIRRELQQSGQVETQGHKLRVFEARPELTGADRAWANQYERGDVLRYARAARRWA